MERYSNYWEKRLNKRHKDEIKKYRDFCSGKIKAGCTYSNWKKHTEEIISKLNLDELEEYRHWLILQIEELEMDNTLKMSFLLPLLVAVLGGMVSGFLFQDPRAFDSGINVIALVVLLSFLICFEHWWVSLISKKDSYKRRYYKDCLLIVEDIIDKKIMPSTEDKIIES